MEKKELPKLEISGFVTQQYQKPTWRKKAKDIVRTIKPAKKETDSDVDIAYKRLLFKTGVCAAVAVTILVVSSLSTPASAEVNRAVDYVVNHEFDVDEDIGRLKFVEALEDTQAVFSALPEGTIVYPADGEVVTTFGEGGSKGVRMSAQTPEIMNIAKGTVAAVGDISGEGYVKVVLDTGEIVTYHNLEPCVKMNDIVMPGQIIGKTEEGYLYVEMKNGDSFIDPIAFLNGHAGAALQ